MDAINDPGFHYTDGDYYRWLLEIELALLATHSYALVPVPPLLVRRDTTEATRQLVGGALHEAVDVTTWTVDTAGKYVVEFAEQAHNLYKQLQLTVDPDFDLTVEGFSTIAAI